jgi:hypothetical protein
MYEALHAGQVPAATKFGDVLADTAIIGIITHMRLQVCMGTARSAAALKTQHGM